jgi:hypothetical protein
MAYADVVFTIHAGIMKQIILLGLALAAKVGAVGAAGFAVSPSPLTNDYQGKLVFNVTNLEPGTVVVVEKYLDANHNGAVDPGEWLVQSFTVQDGQQAVVGGVRNWNVPGDEDGATNGQIRAELFVPGLDQVMHRRAGDCLYRISHPTNAFAAVTQPFVVRQRAFPQGVAGRLTQAGSGISLTNATVFLANDTGAPFTGMGPDTNGDFTLLAAPGNYQLLAFANSHAIGASAGPLAVLANQFTTNNLAVSPATNVIAGTVVEAGTTNGLPGLLVMTFADGNQDAPATLSFTDRSGRFALQAIPGSWQIQVESAGVPLLGCLPPKHWPVANVAGNVSNLVVELPKATALIYGTVTDKQSQPVAGLPFYAGSQDDRYEANGASYPSNGLYCLGVVAGSWWVGPDSDALAALGFVASGGSNVTLVAGQAAAANLVLQKPSAQLQGRVLDDAGVAQAAVQLAADDWAGTHVATPTGTNGDFTIGLAAGTWHLGLSGESASARDLVGPLFSVTLTNGQTASNLVYLVRHATSHIACLVSNSSGDPLANLGVWANAIVAGTNYAIYLQSDSGGRARLPVINGDWTVGLDCQGLGQRGYECVPSQLVPVPAATPLVTFTAVTPSPFILQSPTMLPGGGFQFTVVAAPGYTYNILSTTNLQDWSLLGTTNPSGGTFDFVDPTAASRPQRYYGVERQ